MPTDGHFDIDLDRGSFLRRGGGGLLGLGVALWAPTLARAAGSPTLTPVLGGVLRVGTNMPLTDTLDPATATGQFVIPNIFEPPVRADPLFNLSTAGCSDWSSNTAASVWTFQVQPDAVFSNGRPVISADYAYAIQRILDPASFSPYTATLTPFLAPHGVRTPDRGTLRLELTQPNAFLDILLSGQQFGAIPSGHTDFTTPITSGPFTVEEYQAGTNAVLLRNAHYWQVGRPYLDGVQLIALPQETARLESLLGGAVDLADGLPTSGGALSTSTVAEPIALRGGSWAGIDFLGNEAPFTNRLVIEAIQYSMNRLELLEATSGFGPHLVTPDFEVVPPGDVFYPVGLHAKHYDPERAQSLLTQAGFPNGLGFSLYCANGNVTNAIATTYQSIAQASNVTVTVVPNPGTVFSSTIPGTQNIARSGQRQHVSTALANNYFTGGSTNYSRYNNPSFDKLYLRLLATPNNEGAQKALVYDMCELLTKTWAGVEAGAFDRLNGKSKHVQGLHDVRTYLTDVWLER